MSGSPDRLTPRQHAAVSALLAERTQAGAAQRAGVSEATLRRWMRDPAFLAAYRAARRSIMDGVVTRLQQVAEAAVGALERNLTCGRPGDEIRSAVAILDHAARGLELGDLLERVEELERLTAEGGFDATPQAAGQPPRQPEGAGD